jgi:hypothetical protein
MALTPRILAVTPRYRRLGRAIVAAIRMIDAAPCPVEHLDMANDQPFGREGPGRTGNLNVLYLYSRAREIFLRGDWTHMLTLEDDIVPPADAISKLLACDAPVAYSLYCWRRVGHPWSLYRILFEDSGASWIKDRPLEAERLARNGEVRDVMGLGLGCTLIRRDVLEQIAFRQPATGRAACDWYFALDVGKAGIQQVGHFGVACGHIRMDPSPKIIWPDPDEPGHYRYERFEVPAPELEAA